MIKRLRNLVFPNENDRLMNKVQSHTLTDRQRMRSLIRYSRLISKNSIPGSFVECGTYKGGTAGLLASSMPANRHLWLYDSFQGMPNPTQIDGNEAQKWTGACLASPQDVKDVMERLSIDSSQYTIKEGWFNDTFKQELPEQVSLLHCDADWYDSVILVLETFYDLIPDGGCIILDDFGYWEGCREAFYDFCHARKIKPLLQSVGQSQAGWIKGCTNMR
ncbi:TylF/MycF family methyltransferase [bacterium]|nr:TylF/MycF family methyltransferase [bacterium]